MSYCTIATNSLSPIEIDYFTNLVENDKDIDEKTRSSILYKLSYLKTYMENDIPNGTMRNIVLNGYVDAGDFSFIYNPIEGSINIKDHETEETIDINVFNSSSIEESYTDFDDESITSRFDNQIRFCSICGKPMDVGYTNGEEYICSDVEFVLYMNNSFGVGNWRTATEKEKSQYDYCYMYKENNEWEPIDWYYTEWY